MGDLCKIREIRIPCRIGVDRWEAETPQTLSVDLAYPIDAARAATSDLITDAVDYRAMADGLFAAFEGKRLQLIETAAEQMARWVLQHANVAWVEISVTKEIDKTAAKTATITIRREVNPK